MRVIHALVTTLQIVGELLFSLWAYKRLWVAPLIVVLVAFGLLILLASSSGLAPFIYTMF
jgi:hypothetical protein